MHYVLFAVSALAGAVGYVLVRWGGPRSSPPVPPPAPEPPPWPAADPETTAPAPLDDPASTTEPPPAVETRPAVPPRPAVEARLPARLSPADRPPLPRLLRITIVVERLGQEPPGPNTITLPDTHQGLAGDGVKPKTSSTYLIEDVEVEANDFFDGFSMPSPRVTSECDVVVRDGSNAGSNARHVITRATMPIAVLMTNNSALVRLGARALADVAQRPVFEERIAEHVRKGVVLGWLERHELALDRPARPDPEQ